MDKSASILAFIKTNGPIVPAQVNKHIGVDVMFASAMMAELLSAKKLQISKLKVGGSPLYFLPEQIAQLNRFAHKLSEKDKRTHDLLEQNKVLDESKVDPLVRVSLRQIPDFAKPLMINHEGQERLFWKYFTVKDGEAEILIKKALGIKTENAKQEPVIEELKEDAVDQVKLTQELRDQIKAELMKEMQDDIEPEKPDVPKPEPQVPPPKPVEEVENVAEPVKKVNSKPEPKVDKPKSVKKSEPKTKADQRTLVEEELQEPEDEFYDLVKEYFSSNNIKILNSCVIRKNSDLDLTISMPTPMGDIKYYCKAKSKKKVNDGDLSSAFVQGQMKKMPILFLTTGDVTKKALELAQKEFTTMIIKQLDE